MHSKKLLGLALSLVLSLAADAQTTNHLSLKECLDLALAHNLEVQIDRYSPQIAGYYLRASYGAYDPTLDLTAKRTFVDQPPQFNPKKYPIAPSTDPLFPKGVNTRQDAQYELTVDSVGPGLTGRLPTGLSYNLFSRSDHLDAKTFPLAQDIADFTLNGLSALPALTNDYYATVGVTLRQPLLKDFWIDQYREIIQLNKKNLKISELAFQGQLMAIITAVSTVYYELTFAREQVNVETTALELAGRLLEDTSKKVQAGTLTTLDEKQAESDLETIRTALFAAEQNYSQTENNLKNLLTDNFQSWIDVRIVPSENLTPIAELPPNRSVSWVNALNRRPDMLEMRLNLEKQDIALRFNYNQLFPSLDLVGSYGWQAVERGFSGSLSDIKDGRNPFYSVGVVFSIPLFNVTARNNYKASRDVKKQMLLQFQKLQSFVFTEVDTAVKLAETTFKQITSTHKAAEYAQAAYEAADVQYRAGSQTSYWVLESQRNLIRARSAEIRALADYNIALARLAMSEGTALEKHGIKIK